MDASPRMSPRAGTSALQEDEASPHTLSGFEGERCASRFAMDSTRCRGNVPLCIISSCLPGWRRRRQVWPDRGSGASMPGGRHFLNLVG
jgi:hypothetical protein